MKSKRAKVHEQVNYWLLMAISFAMPFPVRYSSYLLILCGVNWIVEGGIVAKIKNCYREPINVLWLLFFLFHVAGYFMSTNTHEAGAILERRTSLIAMPLLLCGRAMDTMRVRNVSLAFVWGVVVAVLYCIFRACVRYQATHDALEFFYHDLASAINMNGVYLAAYVVFSILILVHFFSSITKAITVPSMILLLVAGILLNSKMMLLVLVLATVVQLVMGRLRARVAAITGAVVLAIIVVVFSIPQTRERFTVELSSNFNVLQRESFRYDTHFTGTSLRLLLWKFCLVMLNEEKAWLTGTGTGDFQDKLNETYRTKGIYTGDIRRGDVGYIGYGPHNEYIEVVFSMGVFALAVLVATLVMLWRKAVRPRHMLLLQLMLLVTLFCITESVLSTNKGIVFCLFFSSLFLTEMNSRSEEI